MTATTLAATPAPLVCERVFPGLAVDVGASRDWTHAVLVARLGPIHSAIYADVLLVVSELFTNAIMHTASGDRGGKVGVLIHIIETATADIVTVHVTDAGQTSIADTVLRDAVDGRGHGLNVVAEMAHSAGRHSTGECHSDRDKDQPLLAGRCVWAEFVIPLLHNPEVSDVRG